MLETGLNCEERLRGITLLQTCQGAGYQFYLVSQPSVPSNTSARAPPPQKGRVSGYEATSVRGSFLVGKGVC